MNPFEILKNAQKLQEQMTSFHESLKDITVTGSAGGGMVEIEVNGRLDPLAVRISPEIVNKEEISILQELVLSALNDAVEKTRELVKTELFNGLPINPNTGFPFL